MREIRIHVDGPLRSGEELRLPDQAAAHVVKVLRLRAGAALTLFDGQGGEYAATLLRAGRDGAAVAVQSRSDAERESPLGLTLLQGVSRGERMDVIVQKATELGVTRIQPLLTEFSVVKLDDTQAAKRRAHWQSIAVGACEQSGRNRVPSVEVPLDLRRWLSALPPAAGDERRVVLAPGAAHSLGALARSEPERRSWQLLIGPEGGLSDGELRDAASRGFVAVSLGPRVLRTETAPLAALALLQGLLGDLG